MIKYNIYENMNLITIIIVIIIIIIIIYFSIIYIDKNNKIIEKFNSENTKLIKADYLNTNGSVPVLHNSPDNQKDVRYPTLNIINKSTATFRPCQIHFNNDGSSKYIYDDDWKEFDTLTSQEDNSVYNVPYKKFGVNNNNVEEIQNFNETTKCFKEKSNMINLNTYKYKSNDLINYKIDTFIDVDYIENNNNYKKSFMQMNFNKQPSDSSIRKYNDDVIDSICSYNYNTNLSLSNIKLYRLTITPPVENNKKNVFDSNAIKEGTITAIDHISIDPKNNSTFIVDDYNTITLNKFPDLLTAENLSYYSIENGNIIYKIEKKEASAEESKGLNVKIYKFNRDFLCSNPIIKSYEISNAIRLKTNLILKATPYNSQPINLQNAMPVHANLSDAENKILINSDKLSRHMINGITEDIVTKSLNIIIKNRYITKEELLNDIKYFIYKLIIISNKNLVTSAVNLINKYDKLEQQKKEFIDSFNTIQKFIKLYNGNTRPIDKARKDLLDDIINKKNIAMNEIYIHKFKHLTQLVYEFPYTLNYTNSGSSNNIGDYEIITYTSNNTFTIAQDTICDILIVAGGGGGGGDSGQGGGGGRVIELNKINIKAGSYNIVVGSGGSGSAGWPIPYVRGYGPSYYGGNGGNSMFGSYIAYGGSPGPVDHTRRSGIGAGGGGLEWGGAAGGPGIVSSITGNNIEYGKGGGARWEGDGGNGYGYGGFAGMCRNWGGGPGYQGVVIVRYLKITITNNRGDLVISNTNNNANGVPIRISMKNKDVNAVINNNKIVLYKNKNYIVDYASNQTRLRVETEAEIIVTEIDFIYTNPGNHTFRVPANVTNICILCVGGGGGGNTTIEDGGGGGGGGLIWVNNLIVTPNQDFNITVGAGGSPGNAGGTSTFSNSGIIISAYGGNSSRNTTRGGTGGSFALSYSKNLQYGGGVGGNGGTGTMGWSGSSYFSGGGGGAGGYTGNGGFGGGAYSNGSNPTAGNGGGGGGGYTGYINNDGIIVYSEPNFGGRSFVKGVGNYNMYGEPSMGLANDELSSVRVPNGYSVTLYYHGNFSGDTITLTQDTPNLPGWFDNQTSGFVVRRNSSITAGGGGGGVGIYGVGGNGIGGGSNGVSGSGGSSGNSGNGMNGGLYGGGGGGGDGTNGGAGGNGVVRIICSGIRSFPSNAAAAPREQTRTIPAVYNTVATAPSNNIRITYEPEDENVINYNNARDNIETETSLPERKKSESNVNIYKIATKNQAYLKVGIIIRNVRDANAQKLGLTFQTHINGGTILKQATDYHIIVQSENSNNAEDIIITGYSIIFLRHISGDIFMKLLNISSTFIYDYTLDPRANFIDIESDYINGKSKSSSLQTIISNHDSSINNYYGLTEFNRERLILYNNRTFFTEDKSNNRISIEGNPNDNNGAMLTRLQNIYNSVLIFNAQDSSRKPEIKFSNNVKVSDCIPIFNIDHVTYENPTENKAPNYESSFHLQKVSNNYVYFRYPYE